jgi:hypothetical protein
MKLEATHYTIRRKRMLRTKPLIIFTLVLAIVALFTYTEAGAVADGDGTCSATEYANNDCAVFGTNVLEYRGAVDGICTRADGEEFPCTYFFYLYTGVSQNQLSAAMLKSLGTNINDAPSTGCSQYIDDNSGDPTTGWVENVPSLAVCRIPASVAGDPVPGPPTPYSFWIAADPSQVDPNNPLSWQARYDRKNVYWDVINGPSAAAGTVITTGRSLKSDAGAEASYELQGGQPVNVTGGRLLPLEHFKLCIPKASAGSPYSFPDDYDCENISYIDNECNIKTTGSDPFTGLGGFGFVW